MITFLHVLALPLSQQGASVEIPQTFADMVKLIGSPVFIGFVLSLMLKEWVWFRDRSSAVKWSITIVVAVLLPIISHAIVLYLPVGVQGFLEEWWPYVATGFGVWVSSQMVHLFINKKAAAKEEPTPESVFEK